MTSSSSFRFVSGIEAGVLKQTVQTVLNGIVDVQKKGKVDHFVGSIVSIIENRQCRLVFRVYDHRWVAVCDEIFFAFTHVA